MQLSASALQVQLSGESVGLLDELRTVSDWWPKLEEEDGSLPLNSAVSGLYVTRKKRNRASGAQNVKKISQKQQQLEKVQQKAKRRKRKQNKKKGKTASSGKGLPLLKARKELGRCVCVCVQN